MMKIVFFGAGAIGSFYGAMLERSGLAEVWFVDRGKQLAALREKGLRVESLFGNFTIEKVNVTDNPNEIGEADLVIVSVKQYQNAGIIEALKPLTGEKTSLMLFQNGVEGHEVLIENFGAEKVIGGVPIISVNMIEPGFVRHVSTGEIAVGEFNGEISKRAQKIADLFQNSGVLAKISDNINEMLWHKLLWNIGFTGLICLTQCNSHEILNVPEGRKLVESAITEAIAVGKAQGYNFAPNHLELIIQGTEKSAPIRTSMLIDREVGNPLEHEAITGVVVRRGNKLGIATPVNELIYATLKVIDTHNRNKSND